MIASCALWRGPCQRATGGRREREMTRICRWLEGEERRGEGGCDYTCDKEEEGDDSIRKNRTKK